MKTLTEAFKKGILFIVSMSPLFSSAFVQPGDKDYLVFEEEKYRIIFDRQYLDSIEGINQKIKAQLESMSAFKTRFLQEPLTILLFSSKNQISNAFATVFPSFTIGMFPSGMMGLQELSVPLWFDGVFEHELNHVFQMSHSRNPTISKILKLPSLLFLYVFSPYPNIFLPMFIVEGDSVLKESLRNYGGRLYNGYVRAFVFSQIKHFQHQMDRFMKKHLLPLRRTPHSGREKYHHGGYFMAMLANIYSHTIVNNFFKLDKGNPFKKRTKTN